MLLLKALLVWLGLLFVSASKLNLPRVLLPLFKTSSTNFTLRTSDNGCYRWTLSRLDIIQIIPLDYDKDLDCSSEVILSTITKEFDKNTVIVLVEEVVTKEVLRCDVITDVIASLNIVTKTRQLFVEESPEIFEVRAYDEQGNEFSTLEGVQFNWRVLSGKSLDDVVKNDAIKLINFKHSHYEIPRTVEALDREGLTGHVVLLEGVKTGTANITVNLPQPEYREVQPVTVQLDVIANLIIEPAMTYALPGDVIYYKLLQVKNGRFSEVPLPSAQYSLNVVDETFAKQRHPWAVETLTVGTTKLVLSDVNSVKSFEDDATYLPSVILHVVTPAFMDLVFLPHRNWITTPKMPNFIAVELYDKLKHKIHIGPNAVVTITFGDSFYTVEKTRNGSHILGYALETGVIPVHGECSSVRTDDDHNLKFEPVTAQAEIIVYPALSIKPSVVILPWDPVESSKLEYPLTAMGGDGLYQWVISDTQVAVVSQSGSVTPRDIGQTMVTVSMQKNAAIQATAKIINARPDGLKIVHNSEKAELGAPIYLAIAMYYVDEANMSYKKRLFTHCDGFPFSVSTNNPDFVYVGVLKNDAKTPEDACSTIMIVSKRAGNAVVTVSYSSEGELLKDSVGISSYEPLHLLSPSNGRTILTIGAQRYLVFRGGPTAGIDSGRVTFNYTESTITAERVYGSRAGEDLIYIVTCRKVGESVVTVQTVLPYVLGGMDLVESTREVRVICAHPKSIRLSTELSGTQLHDCPSQLRAKNMVLDHQPIKIRVSVLDEEGNEFDNATSLNVKWILSNANLGEVLHPDIIQLEEKDEKRYRLPLYHYQEIIPTNQTGDLEVTGEINSYRKAWFKRLGIARSDSVFEGAPRETLKLTLVHNIEVSSESVTIFNHPENIARVYITHGSGYFKILSDAEGAAQINYSESSKSVDIVPVLPTTFTMTVQDECLHSDAISISVQILTITDVRVDVMNKIQLGKTVNAYLTLIDSKGNVVTEHKLANLQVETDPNILQTDCSAGDRTDGRIKCSVVGLQLGSVQLVFKAGMDNSIVRSTPVLVQVYPPLQIYPRNITLIPGASLQLTTRGGPQPDSSIVYKVRSNEIAVDKSGNVIGNKLGTSYVIGEAIGVKSDGEKIVYSVDTVPVNVVHLKGIRLKAPLNKIKSGSRMPIWVEGVPEEISPLVLGSMIEPLLTFKWEIAPSKLAHIGHAFEEIGIKVSDSEKLSMRVHARKSGHVVISVKVSVPRKVVSADQSSIFYDSISLTVFDDLEIVDFQYSVMLLAPEMKYQLKTNKDEAVRTLYRLLNENVNGHMSLSVTTSGLITTRDLYGQNIMQVDEMEDDAPADSIQFPVKVSRVRYMMLNFGPPLQIDPESNVLGVPKGVRLRFHVSYHDNKGNQFTATPNEMKYLVNRMEKVRLSRDKNDFMLDLLDTGVSVLKAYDDYSDIFPEYIKINTVSFVQPDNIKLSVGDFICFQALALPEIDVHSCFWNTSNEHALSIDRKSGFAVAKSKQSDILVSFSCSNNLHMVTTVDVCALLRIDILASGVPNVSNNGKRIFVPVALVNEMEEGRRRRAILEETCEIERSRFYHSYTCELAFDTGKVAFNLGSAFSAYPDYIDKYGHVCVIESQQLSKTHPSNLEETEVVLTVSWNRQQNSKITLPFKPAVSVQNLKLVLTDEEPIDVLYVDGVPSVLSQLRLVPSHEKYITITEEESELKTTQKYAIHLKSAYLKRIPYELQLSVYVVSEATDQNISVPLETDVHANQYASPNYLGEQMSGFSFGFLWAVLIGVLGITIVFVLSSRIYNYYAPEKRKDDSAMFDTSRMKSPLSSPSPMFQRLSSREVQFLYGRSPDDSSLRSRRY